MRNYQEDIDTVEGYLVDELDAVVIFAGDELNAYWRNGHPTISICTSQPKRLQLYSLLHEAGHAIIRSETNMKLSFHMARSIKTNQLVAGWMY